MTTRITQACILALSLVFAGCATDTSSNTTTTESKADVDPLPSWNDGETKQAIMAFVEAVTDESGSDFVAPGDRIATFDNDGTLWSEQPMYFQLFFAFDRIKAMAPDHPEWNTTQPYQAVLEDDLEALMAEGMSGLGKVIGASHAGMTVSEFDKIVTDWVITAKHPTKNKLYTELIYQPMLELLEYLRANDFKTYIVSGGGVEFMRPWTERVYGFPPEQVIGSSIKTKYDYNDGNPVIRRLPELDFIDDKEGKPEAINKVIGKKPIFSAGNSDGDLQMLRWADSNDKLSFKLYVHHTDAEREWAYDRDSHIGKFNQGLDEAREKGWTLVDMANDWSVIYPE